MTSTRFSRRCDKFDAPHVCVTGGEPLAQPNCLVLLERLCDAGFKVSLETSGAMSIARVDPRVVRVVDVKTPGSGEAARNRVENFPLLTPRDQVKFVICSREDYDWSKAYLEEHALERALPGAVLAELYRGTRGDARGLDSGGPAPGAISTAAPQGAVGRRAGER